MEWIGLMGKMEGWMDGMDWINGKDEGKGLGK